jgi:uncharacterized protein (DUF885 family)
MRLGRFADVDRIDDSGLIRLNRRNGQRLVYLDELASMPPTALAADAMRERILLERALRADVLAFESGLMFAPLGVERGPHVALPTIVEEAPFETRADVERVLDRLTWVPQQLRDVIGVLRIASGEGVERGLLPPVDVVDAIAADLDRTTGEGVARLIAPMRSLPASIAPEDQVRLVERFESELLPAIRDALTELIAFVRTEYRTNALAAAASTEGRSARFANHLARQFTAVVDRDRLRAEADAAFEQAMREVVALASTEDLATALRLERERPLPSPALLRLAIDAGLPRFVPDLPPLAWTLVVRSASEPLSEDAVAVELGSLAAGRAARVELAQVSHRSARILAGLIGGRVLGQASALALARSEDGVPTLRRFDAFPAWRLGWEAYASTASALVADERTRAVGRLEIAALALADFDLNSGVKDPATVRSELAARTLLDGRALDRALLDLGDRPGTAIAAAAGARTLERLRARAIEVLGDRFSERAFHGLVLRRGPLPLDALEVVLTADIDALGALTP